MPVTHSFAVAFWHIKAQVFKFLSEKTHSFSRKHESKNEQVTSKEFADHSSTAHANISPRNLPFPDSLNFHSVIKPNTSAAPLCNQSFLNTSVTTTVTTSQSTLSKNSSALTAGTAMPQLSTFESYMQPISYSAGMTTTSTPTVQASGLFVPYQPVHYAHTHPPSFSVSDYLPNGNATSQNTMSTGNSSAYSVNLPIVNSSRSPLSAFLQGYCPDNLPETTLPPTVNSGHTQFQMSQPLTPFSVNLVQSSPHICPTTSNIPTISNPALDQEIAWNSSWPNPSTVPMSKPSVPSSEYQQIGDINNNVHSPNCLPFLPVSLPSVDIGMFDGDFAQYREFKIKVQSVLAASRYSNEMKVIYLKSHLSGDAAGSVASIMPNDFEAYEEIWKVLEEDYGTPALGFDHHLTLLLKISEWSECKTDEDLKRLYRHLSTNYAAIVHYGEDAIKTAEAAKVFILPLLTGYAANKITKLRETGSGYNMTNILKVLKGIVAHSRFLESSKSLRQSDKNKKCDQRPKLLPASSVAEIQSSSCSVNKVTHSDSEKSKCVNYNGTKQQQCSSLVHESSTKFLVNYQPPPESTVRYLCQFCASNDHDLYSCKLYDNRDLYWQDILKNKWCSNCLKTGHKWRQCYKKRNCKFSCGRLDKHVPVLCQKFYNPS